MSIRLRGCCSTAFCMALIQPQSPSHVKCKKIRNRLIGKQEAIVLQGDDIVDDEIYHRI